MAVVVDDAVKLGDEEDNLLVGQVKVHDKRERWFQCLGYGNDIVIITALLERAEHMTRRLIGKRPMTNAEKQQRYRDLRNPKSKLYRQLAKKQRRIEREAALRTATEEAWQRLGGDRLFWVLYVDWPSFPVPYSIETGMDRHAANHYPAMSLAEVLAFPLPAADNCALFMWIIAEWFGERYPDTGHMQAILASKGFQYRAHCIWDKGNEDGTGQMGLGYWFRYEHEVLVVGVRGEIPAPAQGTQWRSVIHHPWLRGQNGRIEHSRKPEVFADLITEYFPTTPKLELFYRALADPAAEAVRRAKREAAGWYFHGNEVEVAGREVLAATEVG